MIGKHLGPLLGSQCHRIADDMVPHDMTLYAACNGFWLGAGDLMDVED